jgi:hypothetical protein
MRLLQVLFSVLWRLGYLGNGILFLYIEWTYLRQGFAQIFNPILHLQILGTLLITPLFWIFLVVAVLGYYAALAIKKQLEKSGKPPDIKADKVVSNLPQKKQGTQSRIPSSTPVQPSYKQADVSETEYVGQQVELLKWAIQSSQKVQFSYEKRDGEKSDRTVTPTGFKTVDKTLCLEGYCNLRKAKRTFAIKRMRKVKLVSPDETRYQPQSFPQSATTQALRTDTPTQTSDQPQSPLPHAPQTLHTEALNQKRPYIKCRLDEIERIADEQWSNVQVLSEIHHELEFRSRKKAQVLLERISQRLMQLQGSQFMWPTTTATRGSKNLSSDVFKREEGLLRQCGYKVGISGLPESQRRQILDSIFLHSLSFTDDTAYLSEWGEPNTDRRLKKLAESIASFTRNAKRRNKDSFSKAIQDWEADLAYLKRTYYDGRFYFQWPRTGVSRS